jgi:hypothetical protein
MEETIGAEIIELPKYRRYYFLVRRLGNRWFMSDFYAFEDAQDAVAMKPTGYDQVLVCHVDLPIVVQP